MTFGLIRAGWPNAAAVLALAAMPIVAFTAEIDYRPRAEPVEHVMLRPLVRLRASA